MRKVNKTLKKKVMTRGILTLAVFTIFTIIMFAPLWAQIVIASISMVLIFVQTLTTKEDNPTDKKK